MKRIIVMLTTAMLATSLLTGCFNNSNADKNKPEQHKSSEIAPDKEGVLDRAEDEMDRAEDKINRAKDRVEDRVEDRMDNDRARRSHMQNDVQGNGGALSGSTAQSGVEDDILGDTRIGTGQDTDGDSIVDDNVLPKDRK